MKRNSQLGQLASVRGENNSLIKIQNNLQILSGNIEGSVFGFPSLKRYIGELFDGKNIHTEYLYHMFTASEMFFRYKNSDKPFPMKKEDVYKSLTEFIDERLSEIPSRLAEAQKNYDNKLSQLKVIDNINRYLVMKYSKDSEYFRLNNGKKIYPKGNLQQIKTLKTFQLKGDEKRKLIYTITLNNGKKHMIVEYLNQDDYNKILRYLKINSLKEKISA